MAESIDDFFKDSSIVVAKKIIGMELIAEEDIYLVEATKPYFGESRQTRNRERVPHGTIMMFNLRGNLHFCISTGTSHEQDYFLIHGLRGGKETIESARYVSQVLGLDMTHNHKKFSDYFGLAGNSAQSVFLRNKRDAPTCLGEYRRVR